MKRTSIASLGVAALSTIITMGFLAGSFSVRADSGAIQLQQLPNLALENEGDEDIPPNLDSNLLLSASFNTNGFGRIVLTRIRGVQTFLIEASNLTPGPNAFNYAYGVFIATAPGSTEFYHVGDLSLVKYNKKEKEGTWRLEFTNKTGSAPPELGVEDVGDLAGLELRIITSPLLVENPSTVALHAILPEVLPDPVSTSTTIKMLLPAAGVGTPPSPNAVGKLTVSFDGRTGRSVIAVQASGLEKGTGYTVYLEDGVEAGTFTEMDELNEPAGFPNTLSGGTAVFDTQRGTPIDFFADTPPDLSGRQILVADPFFDPFNPNADSIHLYAVMP